MCGWKFRASQQSGIHACASPQPRINRSNLFWGVHYKYLYHLQEFYVTKTCQNWCISLKCSWWIKVEAEGAVGNNMEHHGQYAPPGIVQIDKNCEKVWIKIGTDITFRIYRFLSSSDQVFRSIKSGVIELMYFMSGIIPFNNHFKMLTSSQFKSPL